MARQLVPSARNVELEAAVVADPLEAAPRMVYGDWLQSVGHPLGEWTALSTAIEADAKNLQLRATGVDYLDRNQKQILGDGAKLLRGGWLGWRGGFVDELRLQTPPKDIAKRVAALLAQPCCRFVRLIAIGDVPATEKVVAAIVAAAPPLLDSIVVSDETGPYYGVPKNVDALADLATLRNLTLRKAAVTVAMPQLRWLSISSDPSRAAPAIAWLLENNCPNLEELWIDCLRPTPFVDALGGLLAALPKLRRLHVLHARNCDPLVDALLPQLSRLELVEMSLCDLHEERIEKLAATGVKVVSVNPEMEETYKRYEDAAWLEHQLGLGGRDALKMWAGAGRRLYGMSTKFTDERALPLLEASLTMPDSEIGTWAYANAAGVYGRVARYDECELISRAGLLRSPYEPNLFSFLIDALRRSGRRDQALAMVPRALASLDRDNPDPIPHRGATRTCCLVDVMLTYAQLGDHKEVLALAKKYKPLASSNTHAIVAMSNLALGKPDAAKAALGLAGSDGLAQHAHAAMLVSQGQKARAVARLQKAHAAEYAEWHWLAFDPNLAPLRDLPKFKLLVANAPAIASPPVLDDIPF